MNADKAIAAAEFLRDNAKAFAHAKAAANMATNRLKRVKALAMKASIEKSAAAQERDAYASEHYQDALSEEFAAIVEYETLRAKREAAIQLIEVFRSLEATRRATFRGDSIGERR